MNWLHGARSFVRLSVCSYTRLRRPFTARSHTHTHIHTHTEARTIRHQIDVAASSPQQQPLSIRSSGGRRGARNRQIFVRCPPHNPDNSLADGTSSVTFRARQSAVCRQDRSSPVIIVAVLLAYTASKKRDFKYKSL